MKNSNISNLDPYMMQNHNFDAAKDAIRVSVVDGITLNTESIILPELKLPEQKVVQVPVIVKEPEIHTISVPVVVKEYEKIEVPVIVKETEYKTVEVPVIVPEVKWIEKPVIIKEIQYKELPTIVKACLIVQALATVGLLLTHVILKG